MHSIWAVAHKLSGQVHDCPPSSGVIGTGTSPGPGLRLRCVQQRPPYPRVLQLGGQFALPWTRRAGSRSTALSGTLTGAAFLAPVTRTWTWPDDSERFCADLPAWIRRKPERDTRQSVELIGWPDAQGVSEDRYSLIPDRKPAIQVLTTPTLKESATTTVHSLWRHHRIAPIRTVTTFRIRLNRLTGSAVIATA